MPPNDYKRDDNKAPLLAALQPFAPALHALAKMMEDMKAKHQLGGSRDPFNEWAQLPAAKDRMTQAMARHLLPEDGSLWDVNTKDGEHLHAIHGLFNLLGASTLHLRELARIRAQDALREKAAGKYWTGEFGTWDCHCEANRPDDCRCTPLGDA